MWWFKEAILNRSQLYFTPYLYYPHGASLLLHTLSPINALLSLPIHALIGLVAAYNVMVFVSLMLSAYASYLLAYDVTEDYHAAFVGGVAFLCSGFMLSQAMNHLNLLSAEFLIFSILALRRAVARPHWTRILWAVCCLLLTILGDWQYFLYAVLWAGCYVLALLWQERRLKPSVPVIIAVSCAMLLSLPLLLPTAQLAASTASADTGEEFRLKYSADLLDLFIPSTLHSIVGPWAANAQSYKADIHAENKTAYLGIVLLSLAIVGIRQHKSRFWLGTAIFFALLALGPQLQIAGRLTGIPLPAALLYQFFFIRISRFPVRFIVIALLALSVLSAIGMRRLLSILRSHPWNRAALQMVLTTLVIGLLVLDNFTAPFQSTGIYIPPAYAEFGQEKDEYAIFEAPIYWCTRANYLLYQTVHQKPIVGGYLSRDLAYPVIEQIPMMRMFAYAESSYDIIAQEPAKIAPSILSYFNIRYLLLHSDCGGLRYNTLEKIALAAAGGIQPRQVRIPDRSFAIYTIAQPQKPMPFLGIGAGWSPAERLAGGRVTRKLMTQAEIVVYSANAFAGTLQLNLEATQPTILKLAIPHSASEQSIAVQRGLQYIEIPLMLPAGEQHISLQTDHELIAERLNLIDMTAQP